MSLAFSLCISLFISIIAAEHDQEAMAFVALTKTTLSVPEVRSHLDAAHGAAEATGTDQSLLLAIAYYESGLRRETVTREPQGKISCGVMTPVPTYSRVSCAAQRASLEAGYLAGAQHLREWQENCAAIGQPGRRCTLLSYAGGGLLRRYCARTWGAVCDRAYTRRVRLAGAIQGILAHD